MWAPVFHNNTWENLKRKSITTTYLTLISKPKQTSSQEDKSLFPSASSCKHTKTKLQLTEDQLFINTSNLKVTYFSYFIPRSMPSPVRLVLFLLPSWQHKFFRLEPTKQLSSPDPSQWLRLINAILVSNPWGDILTKNTQTHPIFLTFGIFKIRGGTGKLFTIIIFWSGLPSRVLKRFHFSAIM